MVKVKQFKLMYQFTGYTNVNISIYLIAVKIFSYKFVHGEKKMCELVNAFSIFPYMVERRYYGIKKNSTSIICYGVMTLG